MNPEITDQTLVLQRLKEGDEKTFELLFHRYYAALCFFANKILKDESLILDDFLEYLRKSNYDYSKYKIDDSDLLDNEIKLFNDSLNKSQELLKVEKEKEVDKEYDIR